MPPAIDWKKVRQEYENTDMMLKDLAAKYGIKEGTVRSRKNREGWQRVATGKKSAMQRKKHVATPREQRKKEQLEPDLLILDKPELTEKQKLFAEIYVRNFNATQAAIKAGYAPASAFVTGSRLLKHTKVRAYVDELKALKKEALLLSEDDIVERFMRIGFSELTDFAEFGQEEIPIITKDGPVRDVDGEILTRTINVLKFKDSAYVDGGLIAEIKTSRQGSSIKLEDRLKALEWLANYFGMNPDHKYRKEYDQKKLQLERERLEHQKKVDEMKVF